MNTSSAGKAPLARRLEYILRSMEDRVRRLEHNTVVQVGHWRIEEEKGSLIAFNTDTKTRVVLGESDG